MHSRDNSANGDFESDWPVRGGVTVTRRRRRREGVRAKLELLAGVEGGGGGGGGGGGNGEPPVDIARARVDDRARRSSSVMMTGEEVRMGEGGRKAYIARAS